MTDDLNRSVDEIVANIRTSVESKRNIRSLVEEMRILSYYPLVPTLFGSLTGSLQLLKTQKKTGEENKAIRQVYQYLDALLNSKLIDEASAMLLIHQLLRYDIEDDLLPRRILALHLYALTASIYPEMDPLPGFPNIFQPFLTEAINVISEVNINATNNLHISNNNSSSSSANNKKLVNVYSVSDPVALALAPSLFSIFALSTGTDIQLHASLTQNLRTGLTSIQRDVCTSSAIAFFRAAIRVITPSMAARDVARYEEHSRLFTEQQNANNANAVHNSNNTKNSFFGNKTSFSILGNKKTATSAGSSLPIISKPPLPVSIQQLQELLLEITPLPWPYIGPLFGGASNQQYPTNDGKYTPKSSNDNYGSLSSSSHHILTSPSESSSHSITSPPSKEISRSFISSATRSMSLGTIITSPPVPMNSTQNNSLRTFQTTDEDASVEYLRTMAALAGVPLQKLITHTSLSSASTDDNFFTFDPLNIYLGRTSRTYSRCLLSPETISLTHFQYIPHRIRTTLTALVRFQTQQQQSPTDIATGHIYNLYGSPSMGITSTTTESQHRTSTGSSSSSSVSETVISSSTRNQPFPILPPPSYLSEVPNVTALQTECYKLLTAALLDSRPRVRLEACKLVAIGGIPRMLSAVPENKSNTGPHSPELRQSPAHTFLVVSSALCEILKVCMLPVATAVGGNSVNAGTPSTNTSPLQIQQPLLCATLRTILAVGSSFIAWENNVINHLRKHWKKRIVYYTTAMAKEQEAINRRKDWRHGGYGISVGRAGFRPDYDNPYDPSTASSSTTNEETKKKKKLLLSENLTVAWIDCATALSNIVDMLVRIILMCDAANPDTGYNRVISLALQGIAWCCPSLCLLLPMGKGEVYSDPDTNLQWLTKITGIACPNRHHQLYQEGYEFFHTMFGSRKLVQRFSKVGWASTILLNDACERLEQDDLHILYTNLMDRNILVWLQDILYQNQVSSKLSNENDPIDIGSSSICQWIGSLPLTWLQRSLGYVMDSISGTLGSSIIQPIGQENDIVGTLGLPPMPLLSPKRQRYLHSRYYTNSTVTSGGSNSSSSSKNGEKLLTTPINSIRRHIEMFAFTDRVDAGISYLYRESRRTLLAGSSMNNTLLVTPLLHSSIDQRMVIASWNILRMMICSGSGCALRTLRSSVIIASALPLPYSLCESGSLYLAAGQALANLQLASNNAFNRLKTMNGTPGIHGKVTNATYGILSPLPVLLALPLSGPGILTGGYQYSLMNLSHHQLATGIRRIAVWYSQNGVALPNDKREEKFQKKLSRKIMVQTKLRQKVKQPKAIVLTVATLPSQTTSATVNLSTAVPQRSSSANLVPPSVSTVHSSNTVLYSSHGRHNAYESACLVALELMN